MNTRPSDPIVTAATSTGIITAIFPTKLSH
jgi:hypothetical protein